jgi:mono/diheme cytochrome c family protein
MNADTQSRDRFSVPLPVGALLVVMFIFVVLKLIRPVIPQSVVLLYMGFVVLGVVIHVTLDDDRIRRFWHFFVPGEGEGAFMRAQRWGLLAVLPLVAGWWIYDAVRPLYTPPVEIFQRHPTVGEEILSRIQVPDWAAGPAVWRAEDIAAGRTLYQANCAVCHGENLDGNGPRQPASVIRSGRRTSATWGRSRS